MALVVLFTHLFKGYEPPTSIKDAIVRLLPSGGIALVSYLAGQFIKNDFTLPPETLEPLPVMLIALLAMIGFDIVVMLRIKSKQQIEIADDL